MTPTPFARQARRLRVAVTITLALGALVARPTRTAAQTKPIWLVPSGDSVVVLLLKPPPAGGFVVYRSPRGGASARVTEGPVRAVREPAEAAADIGNDLPTVLRMLHTTQGSSVLQRLRADDFTASVLSSLYPSVAHVLGRIWVDHGLRPGRSYTYRVVGLDAQGGEGTEIGGGTVRVRASLPRAVPSLSGKAGDATVTLTWRYPKYTGASGDFAIGFHVYRSAPGEAAHAIDDVPVLRNDATAPRFTDTNVRNGVRYTYTVRAFDVLGREGPGASTSVTPADHVPPAPPTELAVQPGDGVVTLVWRMSPELDAAGYLVERSTGLDETFKAVTPEPLRVDAPIWVDSTVVGGTQYFYRVVAIDRAGNRSQPSNALSAVPQDHTPPAPPTNLTATPANRRLDIAWRPSPSSDVRGYYVYRGPSADRLVRLVGQPVAADTFEDRGYGEQGLRPGGHYLVAVTAVDRSYNESERVLIDVVVPDDEPPAAPTGLHARNVDGRYVELTWSASPSLDVDTYVLSRETVGDTTAADTAVVIGSYAAATRRHAARDTTVALHTRYLYRLVAVDKAGNLGAPATDSLLFRESTPPPAPRYAAASLAQDGVRIRWERVVDRDLAGYYVYRSNIPTGVFERVTDRPVQGLSFLDADGRAEYYYVVRAVDGSGNESQPSPVARARK